MVVLSSIERPAGGSEIRVIGSEASFRAPTVVSLDLTDPSSRFAILAIFSVGCIADRIRSAMYPALSIAAIEYIAKVSQI